MGPIGCEEPGTSTPHLGVWEDRDGTTSSNIWGISLTYAAAVTKETIEFNLVINFKGVVQLLVLCGGLEDSQKFLSNALGQKKQVLLPNLFSSCNHPTLCHQNENVVKHFLAEMLSVAEKPFKPYKPKGSCDHELDSLFQGFVVSSCFSLSKPE